MKEGQLMKEFKNMSLEDTVLKNKTYKNDDFENLGLKNTEIIGMFITQSKIDSCYIRRAKIERCDFTGSKIINCNLEKASIEMCCFNYTQFESSILNIEELLRNIPRPLNLKLFFLKQLYKNQQSMGESASADKILYLIMTTEKEIYLEKGTGRYYESKSQSLNYYIKNLSQWILYSVMDLLFGFGLKIKKIFFSFCVIIFIFAMLFNLVYIDNLGYFKFFIELSIQNILLSNISFDIEITDNIIRFISYIENLVGIIYIAVLTSAIYRKVAR